MKPHIDHLAQRTSQFPHVATLMGSFGKSGMMEKEKPIGLLGIYFLINLAQAIICVQIGFERIQILALITTAANTMKILTRAQTSNSFL